MSKAEEYQKEFGKILSEEGYESPEGTICNHHSLVEDMLSEISRLEQENTQLRETIRELEEKKNTASNVYDFLVETKFIK